ncbi:PbsX family transcriptional regulator [Escherichia coli]
MIDTKDHSKLHPYCGYSVKLGPAEFCDEHFWLLIELSGIRSEKVVLSLKDYLVDGFSRREACERHQVSASYFAISLKRMTYINNISEKMSKYYTGN